MLPLCPIPETAEQVKAFTLSPDWASVPAYSVSRKHLQEQQAPARLYSTSLNNNNDDDDKRRHMYLRNLFLGVSRARPQLHTTATSKCNMQPPPLPLPPAPPAVLASATTPAHPPAAHSTTFTAMKPPASSGLSSGVAPSPSGLPDLPSPPSWLLPTAIAVLILAAALTTLAYCLTFPRGIDAEPAAADANRTLPIERRQQHASARLPNALNFHRSGTEVQGRTGRGRRHAGRTRSPSRTQKVWERRLRDRVREALRGQDGAEEELVELLPRAAGRWRRREEEGGGSAVDVREWGRAQQKSARRMTREDGYAVVPGGEHGGEGTGWRYEWEYEESSEGDWKEDEVGAWRGVLGMVDTAFHSCIDWGASKMGDEAGEEGLLFPVADAERGDYRMGWD
ncbi:hypothetical protein B0J12DRAFT_698017 [Macrophomina phaseolina]|uniref:Uncharacterized protein n=1 Tax=Macrophomina phaseolina TaxID=35725 RepID=A0ABQ8GFZ2_9PEZI|nr:hypothetical protein B0J12DRAFT_698017 [Macrophomina phaseolina]